MGFDHYKGASLKAAADLVNTKGSITGNEYLATAADVAGFVAEHGFSGRDEVTEADAADLRAFRERLREVFEAPEEFEASSLLNALLDELELRPYLTDHDGHSHLHYAPMDASVARKVAASTAMALALLIADHGYRRLGVCSAEGCRDVYVDTSRNRSRRYCNEVCSSRMNVAAYRARHKAETA